MTLSLKSEYRFTVRDDNGVRKDLYHGPLKIWNTLLIQHVWTSSIPIPNQVPKRLLASTGYTTTIHTILMIQSVLIVIKIKNTHTKAYMDVCFGTNPPKQSREILVLQEVVDTSTAPERLITPHEAARIQFFDFFDFRKTFSLSVTTNDRNLVPPNSRSSSWWDLGFYTFILMSFDCDCWCFAWVNILQPFPVSGNNLFHFRVIHEILLDGFVWMVDGQ